MDAPHRLGRNNPRVRWMLGWRKPLLKVRLLRRALQAVSDCRRNDGFSGRFPWTIQVQTTTSCNSACRICPHRVVKELLPQGQMDLLLYEKIVDECLAHPDLAGFALSLQNEPLTDPRLPELLRSFSRRRGASEAVLFLATNGIELTPETFVALRDGGLDFLQVSINANSAGEYERLSPGRSFSTLRRNLDALLSQDLSGMGMHMSFVRTRTNHEEVRKAARAWKERGVPVYVHHLSNRAGALDAFDDLYIEDRVLSPQMRLFRRMVQSVLPVCPYVFFQASILYNGDVLICTHDWQRQVILGNVRENTLAEVWNGETANLVRRKWLAGQQNELPSCKGCTVYRDLAFT